jgi:hypothetical protein
MSRHIALYIGAITISFKQLSTSTLNPTLLIVIEVATLSLIIPNSIKVPQVFVFLA